MYSVDLASPFRSNKSLLLVELSSCIGRQRHLVEISLSSTRFGCLRIFLNSSWALTEGSNGSLHESVQEETSSAENSAYMRRSSSNRDFSSNGPFNIRLLTPDALWIVHKQTVYLVSMSSNTHPALLASTVTDRDALLAPLTGLISLFLHADITSPESAVLGKTSPTRPFALRSSQKRQANILNKSG